MNAGYESDKTGNQKSIRVICGKKRIRGNPRESAVQDIQDIPIKSNDTEEISTNFYDEKTPTLCYIEKKVYICCNEYLWVVVCTPPDCDR